MTVRPVVPPFNSANARNVHTTLIKALHADFAERVVANATAETYFASQAGQVVGEKSPKSFPA